MSGGFSPSILTAVQHASMCAKVVALRTGTTPAHTRFTDRQLPMATLFYLATHGGAEVCDLQARIGSLEPGKAFDALVVSVRTDAGNPAVWGVDLDERLGVRGRGGEHGDEGGRGKTEVEELEGVLGVERERERSRQREEEVDRDARRLRRATAAGFYSAAGAATASSV